VDKNASVIINALYSIDCDFNPESKYLIKHIQINMTSRKEDLLKNFAKKIDNWSKQYLKDEARDRQKRKLNMTRGKFTTFTSHLKITLRLHAEYPVYLGMQLTISS